MRLEALKFLIMTMIKSVFIIDMYLKAGLQLTLIIPLFHVLKIKPELLTWGDRMLTLESFDAKPVMKQRTLQDILHNT